MARTPLSIAGMLCQLVRPPKRPVRVGCGSLNAVARRASFGAERKFISRSAASGCPIRAAGTIKLVAIAPDVPIVARSASMLVQEPPAGERRFSDDRCAAKRLTIKKNR